MAANGEKPMAIDSAASRSRCRAAGGERADQRVEQRELGGPDQVVLVGRPDERPVVAGGVGHAEHRVHDRHAPFTIDGITREGARRDSDGPGDRVAAKRLARLGDQGATV